MISDRFSILGITPVSSVLFRSLQVILDIGFFALFKSMAGIPSGQGAAPLGINSKALQTSSQLYVMLLISSLG